jgi:hypothetical protein
MSKRLAPLRALVLGIAVCAAGRAGAVDITGTWALCMHQTSDPFCPQTLQGTAPGNNFNCLGNNGALHGTATDTSMSGDIYAPSAPGAPRPRRRVRSVPRESPAGRRSAIRPERRASRIGTPGSFRPTASRA